MDGQQIAYTGDNTYVININGTGETQITKFIDQGHQGKYEAVSGGSPAWSPEGRRIAFIAETYSNFSPTSNSYNISASKINELTLPTGGYAWGLSWSPDGEKIAFTGGTGVDHDLEIYVVKADDSGRVKLTDNDAKDNCPLWSLDGRKILFSSNRDGDWDLYIMDADGSNQTRLTSIPGRKWGTVWIP